MLDLRWLAPLDRDAVLALARHTGRCSSCTRTRAPAASASRSRRSIQERAFEWLDAPVRVLGALDTPVPYSPPLEEVFLASEAEIGTQRSGWWGTDADRGP